MLGSYIVFGTIFLVVVVFIWSLICAVIKLYNKCQQNIIRLEHRICLLENEVFKLETKLYPDKLNLERNKKVRK
ncbi:MAG: hypothetical protein ABGX23_00940 [Nautiliaceae bacterium]